MLIPITIYEHHWCVSSGQTLIVVDKASSDVLPSLAGHSLSSDILEGICSCTADRVEQVRLLVGIDCLKRLKAASRLWVPDSAINGTCIGVILIQSYHWLLDGQLWLSV